MSHRDEKRQILYCQPLLNHQLLGRRSGRKEWQLDDPPASKRPGLSDGLRRLLDQRVEPRDAGELQTAVLNLRGHRHVVRIANLSSSGAMIVFQGDLAEGEEVLLQLLDQGSVTAQVRWVRDGRVGVSFDDPGNPHSSE